MPRTTLTLDPDVAACLQSEARKSGRPLKQVANEILRFALNARPNLSGRRRFQVKPRRLGLMRRLAYDDIDGLLERVEGPGHR